jgi:transposase
MKRFIEGECRTQLTLIPECLEDYIGPDNPVRVVDAFVEALLHKSSDRRTSPYPGRIYGIATVTGVPS